MVFRRQPYDDEFRLPPGDLEILESIREELELRGDNLTHDDRDIIDLALRLLQKDLDSSSADEVVEEVNREMLYRQWCAQSGSAQSGGARDNGNEIAGNEPPSCEPQPASPLGKNSI